jgi:hypothetical protein
MLSDIMSNVSFDIIKPLITEHYGPKEVTVKTNRVDTYKRPKRYDENNKNFLS